MKSVIHLLGAGAMGSLIAHELRKLPSAPQVTLLFRNQAKAQHFKSNGNIMKVKKIYQNPNLIEITKHGAESPETISGKIENLIIATKTNQTREALKPYLPLISPSTNILLVQNGFGVADELHRHFWPDVSSRPNLYQGVINHSGFLTPDVDEFEVTHSGVGDLFISAIPKDESKISHQEMTNVGKMPDFIKLIDSTGDGLGCQLLSYSDLLVIRMRKFVSNACSNSITAILDIINREVDLSETRLLYREMIDEILKVFFASKPIVLSNPKTTTLLDADNLLDFVMEVTIVWHGKGTTSTRHDTLMGRKTEVEYLTGFICSEAERLGLEVPVIRTVTRLVRMREQINIKRTEEKRRKQY